MDTPVETMTIMFADVAGSTSLYEKLGDQRANQLIQGVIQLMTDLTRKNSGTLIKTIGDEVMCRFPQADQAFTCANLIQEILHNRPPENQLKLRVRIGLHTGRVLLKPDGDVFGDAVNIAARVAAIARADQIITTSDTIEALSPVFKSSCRIFDRIPLKGKSEETTIYEVLWEADEVTRMSTLINPVNTIPAARRLQLEYQDKTLILNADSAPILLGRGAQCDLIINSAKASRQHARIEFRRGKFVIIDQSTNGTFIQSDSGREIYLRREELPLLGQGVIGLGISSQQDKSHQIKFSV